MHIRLILWIIMVLMSLFPSTGAAESIRTLTGFYYPVGSDALKVSGCGQWLERPNGVGNDCYPETDKYHTGVDMMFGYNVEVRAIADGTVVDHIGVASQAFGANNLALVIEHRSAERGVFRAVYGHIQIAGAKAIGSTVRAGEVVGKIGDWYNGDHLHFGIIIPGRTRPIDPGWYGRWKYSLYGQSSSGFYDNAFIDPIDFIAYNGPDNRTTRQMESVPSLITSMSSWFLPLCWQASTPDSRCDGAAITWYQECTLEKSSLCADAASVWSALKSSGRGSGPGGGGGGSYNLNQDTDIMNSTTGQEIVAGTKNLVPGQIVNVKVQLISEGGDVRNFIKPGKDKIATDYYVRFGGGNWVSVKRNYTQTSNLGAGTHTETFAYTIPQGISEISFRVKVDASNEVTESNESDNWSRIETFQVDDYSWLIPIINLLLED